MRWSEQQLADHLTRKGAPGAANAADTSRPPFAMPVNEAGRYALGRLPKGQMNKTEQAYADHLELQRRGGEVEWFKFEALKLRLADATFYTPDFFVLTSAGYLECHEVKGFWEDDARVKIKVAASLYPFKFKAIKKSTCGWEAEEF
ncbi:DUF1064 domain-containing protein [Tardiphaga sp.]|jgi:hypothetical protein|uniref:DUF1064 domain-containing protein n=1 Tax=Tardiphaga sp. TaxID=1926292 RepID=UPI0037DA2126